MRLVDTNIFIRFLIKDDEKKADRCHDLIMRAATGKITLVVSELAVAELVWVLQSPANYGLTPTGIREILLPLLTMKGLQLPNKSIYPEVLELFAKSGVDFIDAYHAVLMKKNKIKTIYSYDSDFDRLPVNRQEP
jgi:predicted nucleic acid-binding protein